VCGFGICLALFFSILCVNGLSNLLTMIRTNSPDSLIAKADMAFEAACRKVIERARQSNTEIVIWRDGQIVELSPEEAATELEANLAKRDSESAS
jgi:hypothetical protein